MESKKHASSGGATSLCIAPFSFPNKMHEETQFEEENVTGLSDGVDVDIDIREVYFLIIHFLSAGPCRKTSGQFWNELLEHQLLPRRYHAWFSRSGAHSGDKSDDGISLPLGYDKLVERYPHIEKDHLVKLLKRLILSTTLPLHSKIGENAPNAADVPTLLGTGSFSLLDCNRKMEVKRVKPMPPYLRWPHMQADQVRGLSLREIGGGFTKHHRAPSIRSACYAVAKPSTMVQKIENNKRLRGHRNAVYCAIFDRSGRHFITGSDDRLVKIWSMETAFCLASCRGHEGDITDLAVNSNNALVASASNDFVIRVWRLPDGMPVSVLRGHTGAVTAIVFSPRPSALFQLLSSSDDGTCRIWDARYSQCLRIYIPKPSDALAGKITGPSSYGPSSSNGPQSNQILCCAYNANGTVFVTGSSDTFARVWCAPKSNTDEREQPPVHEMDILSGHENDVNYVQFSGCSVASKLTMFDNFKEDNLPKFKNSWFCHDNIVTCSRDGSAIIWVPKSRRLHGKAGRWTRAYHLKVPPPPLPPLPPRGGPRHRVLPTPRGVNMIVWSLDNRFVLAAIMDCRICVWNAVDGSLVHSLTGHTESSYVLDVHPFNPRIAMSAGYDGRTIVWDIWEGTPVRIYELGLGRFKLVDGKFSPDGTSIVLSDDVGQIYLLNTGEGESQKDAKFDQFFLGDYRPLTRDSHGHVLDQETQLAPYRRNIQDLLCDSSMIPYPEPYQCTYQKRRLGALGLEWHPSSVRFAIGLDFSIGQDYQLLPLADLERISEPLPEFIDAMYWEPEIEVLSNDTDSEYHVTEDFSSEGEQGSMGIRSSSASESNTDDSSHKDGLRRSRRKTISAKLSTVSGRRIKKRNLDECDGHTPGSNRTKKSKSGWGVPKTRSSKKKMLRPQRIAARSAQNTLRISESSMEEEYDDDSGDDSSDSESVSLDSNFQNDKFDVNLHSVQEISSSEEQPRVIANKRRLILKFSLKNCKKHVSSGDKVFGNQSGLVSPDSLHQEATQENKSDAVSIDPMPSSRDVINMDLSQKLNSNHFIEGQPRQDEGYLEAPTGDIENKIESEDIEIDRVECSDIPAENKKNNNIDGYAETAIENGKLSCRDEEDLETSTLQDRERVINNKVASINVTVKSSSSVISCRANLQAEGSAKYKADISEMEEGSISTNHSLDGKENNARKSRKIIIKSRKKILETGGEDLTHKGPLCMEHSLISEGVSREGEDTGRSYSSQLLHSYSDLKLNASQERTPCKPGTSSLGVGGDLEVDMSYHDSAIESEAATDAIRRSRSMKMKATSRQPDAVNYSFKVRGAHLPRSSRNDLTYSSELNNQVLPKPRAITRSQRGINNNNASSSLAERESNHSKSSWLMLSEQEGYRYVPQLGDEVAYLRQGHQEFINSGRLSESGPWRSIKGNIRAVEICKVEDLDYATVPSGDSCCKMTLRFIDPYSVVCGESFMLTLPELVDFPDFVVEKARYDASIRRNWTLRDKCLVWWRNADGEGGNWWEGRIINAQAKSHEFPDSPWERYVIQYKSDPTNPHQHSPWELQDPDFMWDQPQIDSQSRYKLISSFDKLKQLASRDEVHYGFRKLNEAAQKSDFSNRFPYPLYPELILLRLDNNYYRRVEAVKHDIMVMIANAKFYFSKRSDLSAMRHLSEFLMRALEKLHKE